MSIVDSNRLVKQKYRLRRIINIRKDIEYLEQQLSGPSGLKITGMPKSQKRFSKAELLIENKERKCSQLDKLEKIFKSEDVILRSVIQKFDEIADPINSEDTILTYQDILIYHYLQDWSMKEIYKMFEGSGKFKEDSDEDSNMRNLYKKHSKAIDLFHKCQLRECVESLN